MYIAGNDDSSFKSSITGVVYITSGTLTNNADLVLGRTRNGTYHAYLEIDGGELYTKGTSYFGSGYYTDCLTEVYMKSGKWTSAGTMNFGEGGLGGSGNGVAKLEISGGETSFNGEFNIAGNEYLDSSITMTGGSLAIGGKAYVAKGTSANAELDITGGSVKSSKSGDSSFYIGNGTSSTGTVSVAGGDLYAAGQIKIGVGDSSVATLKVTGGAVTNENYMVVGINANGAESLLEVDGGEVYNKGVTTIGSSMGGGSKSTLHLKSGTYTTTSAVYVGEGYGRNDTNPTANATLTVDGGTFDNSASTTTLGSNGSLNNAGYVCTLNLNGGTYITKRITGGSGTFTGKVVFDGGTLTAAASGNLIAANNNLTVTVGENDGTIDDNGLGITIAEDITGTGILKKQGKGQAIFTGALSLGGLNVQEGVAQIKAGQSLGAVTIGSKGAIAVDISSAIDTSTAAVGDVITLWNGTSLTLDYENDTLADAIFLAGPAIEYTLSNDNGTVKATITGVDHISSTRKVTTFIAEENYIDQDASWANGQPTHKSYDTIVVCADETILVYASNWDDNNDWGTIHNTACQTMAIRGATVLMKHQNNWNPPFEKNHVVGNGTLQLCRVGLQTSARTPEGANVLTFGKNITVEIVKTSEDSDTWISPCTINGTLKVTTGYTIFNSDIIVNGDAIFTGEGKDSYITASTATGNQFNSDFRVEGGNFDFKSATVTLGENAKLVLAGGTISNYSNVNGGTWPAVEVADGMYNYSDLPASTAAVALTDGELVMTVTEATGESKIVTATGGTLVVDASSGTYEAGSTITLSAATVNGATVRIAGTTLDWTYDSTTGVATAAVPADATNIWVGEDGGDWFTAANWKYGVPTTNQTVAITSDTTISYSKTFENGNEMYVGTLTLSGGANLTLKSTNQGSYYNRLNVAAAISGTGTITLERAGLYAGTAALEVPSTINFVIVNNGTNDSWIQGDKKITVKGNVEVTNLLFLYSTVAIEGKVTGAGTIKFGSGSATIPGDMGEFTGTVYIVENNQPIFDTTTATNALVTVATVNNKMATYFVTGGTTSKVGNISSSNAGWCYEKTQIAVKSSSTTTTIETGYANSDCTYAGYIYDNLDFVKKGTGTWTLNMLCGNGTHTITVDEGRIDYVAQTASSAISWVVNENGTLGGDTGKIKGAVTVNGTLTGTNSYTGTVTFNSGSKIDLGITAESDTTATITGPTFTTKPDLTNATLVNSDCDVLTTGAWKFDWVENTDGENTTYTLVASFTESGKSVTPGETTTVTADDAVAATNMVAITLTEAQTTAGMQASYFKAVATETSEGSKEWTIDIVLDESVVKPELDTENEEPFVISSTQASFKPGNVKKGLYYYTISGTDIGNLSYTANDDCQQATSDNEDITLSATLDSSATVQFYRIGVGYVQPTTGE